MGTSYFVSREIEINEILTELEKSYSSENLKRIINLYGIGGVGKTTLLDKIMENLCLGYHRFVFFRVNENILYKNIPVFIDELSKTIASNNLKIDNDFRFLHEKTIFYQKAVGEIESGISPEEKKRLDDITKKMDKAIKNKGKGKWTIGKFKYGDAEFDLGSYQKNEKDVEKSYEAYQKEYEQEKKRIIESRYDDAETQKFLINPIPIINRCFIDGLKESVYPKKIWRRNKDLMPVKIIIIIDTYEKISDDVNEWLLTFMKNINSFKIEYDFRFVISGREPLILTDYYRRWDIYKNDLLEKDIKHFNTDEIIAYLKKRNLNIELVDEISYDTDGLPYLVEMWCDKGNNSLNYSQAENRIFWWKTEQQKEWIRASAFLDSINVDSLKLFFPNDVVEVFEFLKECHEVTHLSDKASENLSIHPIIKMVLRRSTELRSPDLFQEYNKKVELHNYIIKEFNDISIRKKMSNLSLFKNFNQISYSLLSEIDAFEINDFVNQNNIYFRKNKHSFSMLVDYRNKFLAYKKYTEPIWLTDQLRLISEAWDKKKAELSDKIDLLEKDRENITKSIDNDNKQIYILTKKLQELSTNLNQPELKPIINSITVKKAETKNYPIFTIIIFALSVLSLIFGFFNKDILSLSVMGFIVLTILSIIVYFKFEKNKSIISENPTSKSDNDDYENKRKEQILLKDKLSEFESNLEIQKRYLSEKEKEINKLNEILEEPYI
ncbi:MAG TPA: ATP-binding protein [Ignavibacteria bacterium]